MACQRRGWSITSSTGSNRAGSITSQCSTTRNFLTTCSPSQPTSKLSSNTDKRGIKSGFLIRVIRGLNRQSTVDLDHLAGDVASVVGEKEGGDARDFVWFRKATERDLFANLCLVSLIQLVDHIRGYHAERE